MPNVNVLLDAASVQVIDLATNNYRVNTGIGTITLPASVAAYDSCLNVAISPGTVLSLPTTTVWFFYVKNLDAAANITVQFQVTGGSLNSAANSEVLAPGGVKLFCNPTEAAHGIIAVTLISSVGNTAVEVLTAS